MNIKVIGSGSSGNSYLINDGNTALLIECGLPISKIKKGIGFGVSSIKGCLCSHAHKDHSHSASDIMGLGINLYCSEETASECHLNGHRLHLLKDMKGTKINTLEVFPFPVHHDVKTYAFYIYSYLTGEKLLFMTDSAYTEYKFPGLTHIMMEVSFSEENIEGEPDAHRLRRSHMSVENAIKMLKANDLSKVQEIWLLHLSKRFGDSEEFKRKVQEVSGCPTYIA